MRGSRGTNSPFLEERRGFGSTDFNNPSSAVPSTPPISEYRSPASPVSSIENSKNFELHYGNTGVVIGLRRKSFSAIFSNWRVLIQCSLLLLVIVLLVAFTVVIELEIVSLDFCGEPCKYLDFLPYVAFGLACILVAYLSFVVYARRTQKMLVEINTTGVTYMRKGVCASLRIEFDIAKQDVRDVRVYKEGAKEKIGIVLRSGAILDVFEGWYVAAEMVEMWWVVNKMKEALEFSI